MADSGRPYRGENAPGGSWSFGRGFLVPPKTLRWWAAEWDRACALACLYRCELSLDQFCAARGLEECDRNQLLSYFVAAGCLSE